MTELPPIISPVSPAAQPGLVAIDRAIGDLRRGGFVVILSESGAAGLVQAAEAVTPESLERLEHLAGKLPVLAITGRRAAVLGLGPGEKAVAVSVTHAEKVDVTMVRRITDPCSGLTEPLPSGLRTGAVEAGSPIAGAVALAKLARLLPAAVVAPLADDGARVAAEHGLFRITVDDIASYQHDVALSLRQVSDARVPLAGAEQTRIVAFRPADGGIEHLAIIIGDPDGAKPVLARLHSECFTGDLLGSLRCDCGDQLRGAIAEIAQAGSGVLLYLAQEGRGIGLVNKLRAYKLQDDGFDTLDANGQLGFDDDERIYQPAAEMLRLLGFSQVRLMTNNPLKVDALARHGIAVAERVPHVFPANDHNELYLRTKATRSGHLF